MDRVELENLWRETLRSPEPDLDSFALAIVEYSASDSQFRQHVANRSKRVKERTGTEIDPEKFDVDAARAFIADEIGFASWNELLTASADPEQRPLLFCYAIAAMDRGDFTALESAIGEERFHEQVVEWFEDGMFDGEQQTLDEVLSAACMLGQTRTAEYLLDKGVDPYAGMKTGLAGPHYAASSGRLETIRMLLKKGIPLQVKNMYGGTVFGQAIWSAVNEYTPDHAAIVEALVEAGALVDDGYLEWWEKQDVPDATTKKRIAEILERQAGFAQRASQAEQQVAEAESGSKHSLADALKHLGSILRRPPFTRGAANEAYRRAAALYAEVGLPLEEAWVKRHIGINHEYAGRLEDAEALYDEALALYREHATEDNLDYANTVRYPAVIKARLGKRDEAAQLWEEACRRYEAVGIIEGVVEANARMAELAIEEGDLARARHSFDRAAAAAEHSADPDTQTLVDEVRAKMEKAGNAW